jgi:hypothetical protein
MQEYLVPEAWLGVLFALSALSPFSAAIAEALTKSNIERSFVTRPPRIDFSQIKRFLRIGRTKPT